MDTVNKTASSRSRDALLPIHKPEDPGNFWPCELTTATALEHLSPALRPAPDNRLADVVRLFPMRINAYFQNLISAVDDPLGRQVIPNPLEVEDIDGPLDPLGEENQSPVPQLIHRYPHRVNFLVSNRCALFCRFCTRKRRLAERNQVSRAEVENGLTYIASQNRINEVILSGGDPLMLSDRRLLDILSALRRIRHVRILRIHTRIPVALPQRIQAALVRAISDHHPLFINIHVNHPSELTAEAARAITLMANAGIPLGSQTVLLKGVNDDARTLGQLMEALLALRVRPYYVHQLDRVPGTAHFQVTLEKSIRLVHDLRGPLSGMGVPHLMVDLPRGGGKVALTGDAVVATGPDQWRIRNWEGKVFDYPLH